MRTLLASLFRKRHSWRHLPFFFNANRFSHTYGYSQSYGRTYFHATADAHAVNGTRPRAGSRTGVETLKGKLIRPR